MLNDEIAKDWLKKGVSFQLKAHSFKPDTYSLLAGIKKAKFAKYGGVLLPFGLAQALKYGYNKTEPTRAGIQSVIIKQNIEELPQILRFARGQGLFVHFERLMIEGRARKHPEIIPSEKDIENLFNELSVIDSKEFGIKPRHSTSHYGFEKMCWLRLKYQLVIGSTGNAKICYSNSPKLALGMNVKEYSLERIQKKKPKILNKLPSNCVCMHYSNLKQ